MTPINLCAADQLNHLTKAFLHQGILTDKVVCYFSKEPIFNKLPQKKQEVAKGFETITFFLPMAQMEGNESRAMIKKVQETQKNNYSINFQEVVKPIKGMKVIIAYNPQKILYEYQLFDAITGSKGLVFTFHNKDILTQLKHSTDPLLQYAYNTPKSQKIMLDIGHGGHDEGKVGYFNVQEKNITLQVGTKVADCLKRSGFDVELTRSSDYFVALDERTTLSNKKKVDLFLSIHANSGSSGASGIETYWLDSVLLKKPHYEVQDAMVQQLTARRDTLSSLLAQQVHNATVAAAKKIYNVIDRKVKRSVTQVLLGTEMSIPAALIEIGFLSHEQETKYLMDKTYQMTIAQGIAHGIINYLKKCTSL